MQKEIALQYFSSDYILNFFDKHPQKWCSRELADKGNVLTPTPAFSIFFELLREKEDLFTYEEYINSSFLKWQEFFTTLTEEVKNGLKCRLQRQFYPSAIDSLYIWALLVESNQFSICLLDTEKDVVSKTDLIVFSKDGEKIRIAHRSNSQRAQYWKKIKSFWKYPKLIRSNEPKTKNRIGAHHDFHTLRRRD